MSLFGVVGRRFEGGYGAPFGEILSPRRGPVVRAVAELGVAPQERLLRSGGRKGQCKDGSKVGMLQGRKEGSKGGRKGARKEGTLFCSASMRHSSEGTSSEVVSGRWLKTLRHRRHITASLTGRAPWPRSRRGGEVSPLAMTNPFTHIRNAGNSLHDQWIVVPGETQYHLPSSCRYFV